MTTFNDDYIMWQHALQTGWRPPYQDTIMTDAEVDDLADLFAGLAIRFWRKIKILFILWKALFPCCFSTQDIENMIGTKNVVTLYYEIYEIDQLNKSFQSYAFERMLNDSNNLFEKLNHITSPHLMSNRCVRHKRCSTQQYTLLASSCVILGYASYYPSFSIGDLRLNCDKYTAAIV
ncbi:hypothetical protein BDF20DRAFT_833564 [Mycotypha africana]|uniref:uncharacterized protein n=1 Tax=Mycotypha africana TaxID=64632 RepID=UPI002300B678|nr:uncharacterized protein BDF20DRAFT_833564 [Mycotypha africana]KAI8984019.1 hypothetical protein BDF20DRAFT_833564 [Mycotypha africana]